MSVKYSALVGIEAVSLDAVDLTSAAGAGSEFALTIPNHGTPNIAWQTLIDGIITSITVSLEASLDGDNWFVIDSSTSITGELRVVSGSYRFLRANNSAVVDGAGSTITATFTYAFAGNSSDVDRILYNDSALDLSTTGTVEEVLKTVTIPANTFNGDEFTGFEVLVTLDAAANTNGKTCRIRIGGLAGTIVAAITTDNNSGNRYQLGATFQKNTSSSLNGTGFTSRVTGVSTLFGTVALTGLVFTSTLDVTVTGLTATAADDITLTSMRVVLLRRKL